MHCHHCKSSIDNDSQRPISYCVASDCQPVLADLVLACCPSCGLTQKSTDDAWQKTCGEIYTHYKIYQQGAGAEQKVKDKVTGTFLTRSDLITGYLTKSLEFSSNGKIADIGCGTGVFLKAFHRAHPDWLLYGSEINSAMRDDIESISPAASFLEGNELFETSDRYDVMTLIHCLEHVPDPKAFLERLRALLEPGGSLFIQVPDTEINPFDLMVADHASHFSKSILQQIVADAGFDIVQCGNILLGKEITLLARPSQQQTITTQQAREPFLSSHLRWLETLRNDCNTKLQSGPLGLFGSSIAASWIASLYSGHILFFVDEDEIRSGRTHMGIPIINPQDVPAGSRVYFAMEPTLAHSIASRLQSLPVEWITPADVKKAA